MVKIFVLSEYSNNPPAVLGTGRIKIARGPLYELAAVQALVQDEEKLKAWTDKCRNDLRKWFDDDLQRVADLIGSLKKSDYIDSEWCENGKGAVAACDAYSIRRFERAPATGQALQMDYFLKFAVSKTGTLVLMVSCHP
ncbi:hypothetical protein F3K02_08425 [Hydrogenophaga sp. D2P1]|uniref:Uncharacterized protein n=1 Tax=Hydrogenophaga aromaticivorans TaxID=2610898 RepID=A0A7Y8GUW5_9BURK|nr:hypothetical protein [Hydrogenophaga aromaticivorans]NWF45277.1 hypothetical protein [Hydrogenophaga aromaticivorans]